MVDKGADTIEEYASDGERLIHGFEIKVDEELKILQ